MVLKWTEGLGINWKKHEGVRDFLLQQTDMKDNWTKRHEDSIASQQTICLCH